MMFFCIHPENRLYYTASIEHSIFRNLCFRNPTLNPMNRPEQALSRAFHATNPSLKAVKRLEEIKDPPSPCLALLSWYLAVVSDF